MSTKQGVKLLKKIRLLEPTMPTRATGVFKGEASGFLNWNDILYEKFYDVYTQVLNNFWKPSQVSMVQDKKQWGELDKNIQDKFLEILTMLSGLDSLQTPTLIEILKFIKDPAVKAILANFAQQESIHNESYSYVNSSLIPLERQKELFKKIQSHPQVIKRNKPIVDAYQRFVDEPTPQHLFEALIHSTNLEGIYFYLAFAFYYNLGRQQLMTGTATMISYIHRDEMVHFDFIATLVQILMYEYPELNTEENVQFIYDTIGKAVELEKEWSEEMLGDIEEKADIDLDEFHDYIEYLANKRLRMFGLDNLYEDYKENPMPWIKTFDDESINLTKTDFFEQKSRTYAQVSTSNGFDEL
ncbi:ribonucleotide-diphosphate reductase subunit beta [Pseudobacillus badius]|uniref:ribonucleotide-diphosphate reductase subunit beta n=1 Tax=Bacillus badius TaxID=1455 RepID=UPI0007B342EA|nr:ribonucleotide-diphosphate reductase subunit beta [Bacillus badius]KZR57541.1 ribonucleotide-diphosphate reductase subunit beta [Bacillus badius]